jgi:hypothetical protein
LKSKSYRLWILALALVVTGAGIALAIVTFDPVTGTGFVGKGDVQEVFGWNNKDLQNNANSVQFRLLEKEVTETTWTCDRDAGPQTQERARTTTTDTQGVVSSVARERNQITGFNLIGYEGTPTTTSTTEGPAVGSCPTGWSVSEGPDTETISSETHLQVSNDNTNWFNLT